MLTLLRARGFSVIESIKVVRTIGSVDLGKAKSVAHYSVAFSDQREGHEAFHRALAAEFGVDPEAVAVRRPTIG